MIFDLFFYVISGILAFVYEVINFPLSVLGYNLNTIFSDFGLAQVYGFLTDILFPQGFLLIFFSYISIVIMVDMVLSIIDRRKQ